MTEKDVKVKLSADITEFKRAMKEATSLPKKMKQSTFGSMGKVQKQLNKDARKQGKAALGKEKALRDLMKSQLKILNDQSKAREKDLKLIKQTNTELRRTKALHDASVRSRGGTGVRSGRERAGGALRGAGRGLGMIGGMGLRALGLLGGVALGGVAAAGAAVAGDMRGGYGAYTGYGRAAGRLSGTGYRAMNFNKTSKDLTLLNKITGRSDSQDYYKLRGFGRSEALGYGATETLGQMSRMAAMTGGGSGLLRRTQMAQNVSRQYGGDVGSVTGFMGQLTKAGGSLQKREFQRTMSHAMESGMNKSRAGEAMQAMGAAIASAGTTSGGKVNAGALTAMMAMMGRKGGAGLQGMRGLGVLSGLDGAVKGFGQATSSAEANKALFYQTMGFGSGAKGTDFFSVTRRAQQGIQDTDNVMGMLESARQAGGGNIQARDYALSAMTGGQVSMDQASKLFDALGGPNAREEIAEIMKESLPVDQQIADSNREISERTANLDNRMIEIGKSSAKSMEQLQDLRNSIVDALMPLALKAFQAMVTILKGSWETLEEILSATTDDKDSYKDFNKLRAEARDVENDPTLTDDEKAERLAELHQRMGKKSSSIRNRGSIANAWNSFVNHGVNMDGWANDDAYRRAITGPGERSQNYANRVSWYQENREGMSPNAVRQNVLRDQLKDQLRGMVNAGTFDPENKPGHARREEALRRQEVVATVAALGASLSEAQMAAIRASAEYRAVDARDYMNGAGGDVAALRVRISTEADTASARGNVD